MGGQQVDLFIESEETAVPVEVKLFRPRYDNGNIDPNECTIEQRTDIKRDTLIRSP